MKGNVGRAVKSELQRALPRKIQFAVTLTCPLVERVVRYSPIRHSLHEVDTTSLFGPLDYVVLPCPSCRVIAAAAAAASRRLRAHNLDSFILLPISCRALSFSLSLSGSRVSEIHGHGRKLVCTRGGR